MDRDLFEGLCRTLASALAHASDSSSSLAVALAHISRWKTFLSGRGGQHLSAEEVRGLFAELTFLLELLDRMHSTSAAIDAWLGPERSQQDFIFGNTAVEIKSLSGIERSTVRISSEDQLESLNDGLFLRIYRLSRDVQGSGLEQAAFVHEILGLGLTAEAVAEGLERIAAELPNGPQKRQLRALIADAKDLRERLRRNGIYLSEMTGVEGRKRRSRLKLRDRFEPVAAFYKAAAERRQVSIVNDIPPLLVSPPIFPAEAAALFSNLVSNAVKFAGSPGTVRATGSTTDEEVIVRIENTGVAVELRSGERWFEPFRSTTAEVDPKLGQGMGLGLTVSRSLMDEYGGVVRFVPPSNGFATAIELRWPRR